MKNVKLVRGYKWSANNLEKLATLPILEWKLEDIAMDFVV